MTAGHGLKVTLTVHNDPTRRERFGFTMPQTLMNSECSNFKSRSIPVGHYGIFVTPAGPVGVASLSMLHETFASRPVKEGRPRYF
eukprot:746648-Hanusia_phi.AAC.7